MKNILCFGESVTYGAGDSQGGWVSRVRHIFEKESTNKAPLVYNLGVSSDTTNDLRKRFLAEVDARVKHKPEEICIIFGIGGNDASFITNEKHFVTDIKDFESNIIALITEAKKFASKIVILSLTPIDIV